ncbi:MAG: hypothetical protein H0W08_16465 [Acidobacteria bacterium]|nr:hypothetical protein [Acidobacteriota bacterium]
MNRHSKLSLAAVLLAGACAVRQAEVPPLPVEAVSGHVTDGPTGTWFTPCSSAGGTSRWWVTYVDASVAQARNARNAGLLRTGQRTFVRWRASGTDDRLLGPGGPALLVRDIFEIRASSDDDCRRQDR